MRVALPVKIAFFVILSTLLPILISVLFQNPILTTLTGLFSAVLSIIFVNLFLKPLRDLQKSTENLAAGNFNQRVDIRSGDEFENTGKSFNTMSEKLSAIFQNLEKEKDSVSSQKNKLDEVLAAIIDGIIAIDFNKNIILTNKAAEELTGFSQQELLGQNIEKYLNLFVDNEEVSASSYCQPNFSKSANLVGKDGKQAKINLLSASSGSNPNANLSCILILHDLSKEEELERMKLDFVSMASHELRTPLTSIVGYLSVFFNENKGKIEKEEMDLVDKALISGRELLILVQNLLSVNKIERVQMFVSAQPMDYLPVLSKSVENLKSIANQKNIVLNLNIPAENLPKVLSDPLKIEEVITNLVANAINYTNPGGKVDVSLQISPAEITTTISDTGIGIPQEAIPHLFNKFFRVSNSTQQASKGTGLGLYISKSIIDKLNGKIWVESEYGKGSKFSFTLPLVIQTAGTIDSNKFISSEIQSGALNY